MSHPKQVTADGLFVHAILQGKLLQSLLALDIVGYNLGFVSTTTTQKLSLTGLASIQLFPTSDTVANYF